MTAQPPARDRLGHDFDHTDPQWVADPYPIWDELRDGVPDRAQRPVRRHVAAGSPRRRRGDRVRHRALHVAFGRGERGATRRQRPAGADRHRTADHLRPAVPRAARAGCCSRRSDPRRSRATSSSRASCAASCSTRLAGRHEFDAAVDYAQHIPLRVIVKMLGFPQEDADIFRRFIHQILEDVEPAREEERREQMEQHELDDVHRRAHRGTRARAAGRSHHVPARSRARRQQAPPRSRARHDGAADDRRHRHDLVGDRRVALASRAAPRGSPPARRRARARADRGRGVPPRAYAPVTMARMVAEDFEFEGCPFEEDDWVLLPFPAANRDPERVPRRRPAC